MTSSITTAEPRAGADGTQQGTCGPGGTLTVWCLVFCLYRIYSDCGGQSMPVTPQTHLGPPGASSWSLPTLSREGRVLCPPHHRGAWGRAVRNKQQTPLPSRPRNCFLNRS